MKTAIKTGVLMKQQNIAVELERLVHIYVILGSASDSRIRCWTRCVACGKSNMTKKDYILDVNL